MTTELELELNLDAESRTTFDPSKFTDVDRNKSQADAEEKTAASVVDYSSKTVLTSLADDSSVDIFHQSSMILQSSSPSSARKDSSRNTRSADNGISDLSTEQRKQRILDDILFDCEITDCALLPRTFWMPCTGMKPRCTLERCALEVFYHHIRKESHVKFDPSSSGAEWWVQIRPSPPAGRYKLLVEDPTKSKEIKDNEVDDDGNNDKTKGCGSMSNTIEVENERNGICFHWDKDEDLRLMMDGKMYIHPHISTVTYLSGIGAPTMALNYRVNALTGEYITPNENENVKGFISWPKKGKHLSFDGRYLHAAPFDFMTKGLFENQTQIPDEVELLAHEENKNGANDDSTKQKKRKVLERRYRRVTFLVNIWLNYKPFNVEIFPESMVDKLSNTHETNQATHIFFKNDEETMQHENQQCEVEDHIVSGEDASSGHTKSSAYKQFQWSMGSCNNEHEAISMRVPLTKIQEKIGGGNIKLSWEIKEGSISSSNGIQLFRGCSEHQLKKQRIE